MYVNNLFFCCFTHVRSAYLRARNTKSPQKYCFFLTYANFCQIKCQISLFFCSFIVVLDWILIIVYIFTLFPVTWFFAGFMLVVCWLSPTLKILIIVHKKSRNVSPHYGKLRKGLFIHFRWYDLDIAARKYHKRQIVSFHLA